MARPMKLAAHLSTQELEERYHKCKRGIEKPWWQALWLISQGKHATDVAPLVGRHPNTVRSWVKRYNEGGCEAVRDLRQDFSGPQHLLNQDAQKRLIQALNEPHPDGGLWSGPKVRCWIEAELGHPVAPNLGWRYLKHIGWTPQTPRPRSHKADPAQQAAFKK
jgi:transposase